jgi:serine O-acetyltransferase
VTVGDGARVAANAVVVHDVLPHTTVVDIPARVVRRRQPEESVDRLAETSHDAEPAVSLAPEQNAGASKLRPT